jgi:hypothetical protein
MEVGKTTIACGPIGFALQYRNLDGGADADQGVCIQPAPAEHGAP